MKTSWHKTVFVLLHMYKQNVEFYNVYHLTHEKLFCLYYSMISKRFKQHFCSKNKAKYEFEMQIVFLHDITSSYLAQTFWISVFQHLLHEYDKNPFLSAILLVVKMYSKFIGAKTNENGDQSHKLTFRSFTHIFKYLSHESPIS